MNQIILVSSATTEITVCFTYSADTFRLQSYIERLPCTGGDIYSLHPFLPMKCGTVPNLSLPRQIMRQADCHYTASLPCIIRHIAGVKLIFGNHIKVWLITRVLWVSRLHLDKPIGPLVLSTYVYCNSKQYLGAEGFLPGHETPGLPSDFVLNIQVSSQGPWPGIYTWMTVTKLHFFFFSEPHTYETNMQCTPFTVHTLTQYHTSFLRLVYSVLC